MSRRELLDITEGKYKGRKISTVMDCHGSIM
jgi:hypothetical protein